MDLCREWGLEPGNLPRHVGIIMDGNGRWASQRRLPRVAGHRQGVERVREITEMSGKLGIEALTLFAFSDENWRRPEEEVSALMGLLRWYLRSEKSRIIENNVQFRMIGDRRKISSDILELVSLLERDTEKNTGMCLGIALSYGARGEIVRAAKRLMAKVQKGEIFPDDIDEDVFESQLDTSGLGPVDLLIRTSGELRVSNFLLWQIAYAEMCFPQVLWPDFNSELYAALLRDYTQRERRFGLTPEQVAMSAVARGLGSGLGSGLGGMGRT